MPTSFTNGLLLILLLCGMITSKAQENLRGFWEPEVEVNYDLGKGYSHNFALATRLYTYDDNRLTFRTRQLELGHFSGFSIRGNQSLALGVMYRWRESFEPDENNELRVTEQYNITRTYRRYRLGHRFRLEQRIQNPYTVHRMRYRLALDAPLQGEILNAGETYLVLNTESLLSLGKSLDPEYEQRLEIILGWHLEKGLNFETGLEYRLDDYTQRAQHLIFINNSLSISF
ncbi:DUF2490 domain-containing protein [Zeaxanthinibacter sp. PT1]|uniref:DUF2490 domain-containing protein n=1 Tax=Zeaxanthinibacter TaxID=561554 RepID=UPI00234A0C82|nr:DUF2490 domain-containing protein [Zeaxanthinibacter sp. PT1]MDC6351103.1 DUF2490 domain-containing protein [Zeaxanthinibacter sp. PT1]